MSFRDELTFENQSTGIELIVLLVQIAFYPNIAAVPFYPFNCLLE